MAKVNKPQMPWPPYDVGEEPDVSRDDDGGFIYKPVEKEDKVSLADWYQGGGLIVGDPSAPRFPRMPGDRVFVPAHRRGRSMVKAFWRKRGGGQDDGSSTPVEVFPEQFAEFAREFIAFSPMGRYVPAYEVEDYKTMRTFVASGGLTGGALRRNGDHIEIMSLFNMGEPGGGARMLDYLVDQGASRARVIGAPVRDFYLANGFSLAREEPWDESIAPRDWDVDAFGLPNVYVMERS